MQSPFIAHGSTTQADSLALLQLKRDLTVPIRISSDPNAILNTRFGNYPHKTLLNIPWGSQVLASKTLERNGRRAKRQKLDSDQDITKTVGDEDGQSLTILGTADAGFAHVLPPTAEGWTMSLPHRTQVVYTPDYSYILQRLRVRPGSVIIEAGAGSGSFTHAAARAVYNGDSEQTKTSIEDLIGPRNDGHRTRRKKQGRVFSYEYHKPRVDQLEKEIREHGLDDIVTVTHRDVYEKGFLVDSDEVARPQETQPQATAIFLDLPAPWLALKHLGRNPSSAVPSNAIEASAVNLQSPLSPKHTVHICTFSPCIEQVQQTATTLASLGWTDIETITLSQKDIILRRERIGVAEEGSRDGNPTPATVEEAVNHLRQTKEIEDETRKRMVEREANGQHKRGEGTAGNSKTGKEKRIEALEESRGDRKLWREGRLVSRSESELKGHTSFLTFAILPRSWSENNEAATVSYVDKPSGGKDLSKP